MRMGAAWYLKEEAMAKKIRLDIPGVRVNETGHRVLSYIADCARKANRGLACEPVAISRRNFCRELGISETGAIRTCHALEACGLMVCTSRTMEDGGQIANRYHLTALGLEVLRLCDVAVAEGRVGVS